MTNIGAIGLHLNPKSKGLDHLVFVADSMSSNREQGKKGDNAQKLFKIGNHLLMGTGSAQSITTTAIAMSKQPKETAEELAETILKSNYNPNTKTKKPLNFILGGPSKQGLGLFHVNTKTGNIKPENIMFDGSGFVHVSQYAQSIYEAGHRSAIKDVADALLLCFDYGKQGAKDMGVNDKMQYGIISPKRLSTIYHPEIELISNEFLLPYLEEMTGINLKFKPNASKKHNQETTDRFRAGIYILRNIYTALQDDLQVYSLRKTNFTSTSEDFANGTASLKELKKHKSERQEAKQSVVQATQAIISKGLDNLLAYQKHFDSRKKENETNAFNYFSEQKT